MSEIIKIPLKIDGRLGTNKIYAGVHWTKRSKDKENMRLLVRSIVGIRKEAYQVPVEIEMAFKSRLDVSNHSYLFKLIEDSLVKCNIIANDTDKFVKKNIITKQNNYDGVVVTITTSDEK